MKAKKPFVLSPFGRKCATPQGLMVLQQICVVSLIALIALCIAWEGKLAPLKPGGSLLILKVVPLLLPLFGILRGKRYTFQWSSMFMMIYFTEGVVRAYSDTGLSAQLALIEVALSSVFFMASIFYAKYSSVGVQEVWRAGNTK